MDRPTLETRWDGMLLALLGPSIEINGVLQHPLNDLRHPRTDRNHPRSGHVRARR